MSIVLAKTRNAWLPAVLFLLFASLSVPPLFFGNPDTFWHIRLGQVMLETGEIVTNAVGSYAALDAPYVPHEAAFQVLAAWIYGALGWKGFLLLRLACDLLLWGGLIVMLHQAARERGGEIHPLSYAAAALLLAFVDMMMFTVRPQVVSIPLIVWAFVLIRSFQEKPSLGKVLLLGLVSMTLANFHGGVWPLLPVLWLMTLLERKWTGKHVLATAAIAAGGLLNPGGAETILYVLPVSSHPLTAEIPEWGPVPVTNPLFAGILLAYLWCMVRHAPRTLYHFALSAGILLLGMTAIRQFAWIALFLPYFLPVQSGARSRFAPAKRVAMAAAGAAGMLISAALAWISPLPSHELSIPVREMAYIRETGADHPKVLAPYAASGYVFFSGGRILADGRFDPFVHDLARSPSGLTAAERSRLIFQGNTDLLWEEIETARPDFLIWPKKEEPAMRQAAKRTREKLGDPDFEGPYGYVWNLGK